MKNPWPFWLKDSAQVSKTGNWPWTDSQAIPSCVVLFFSFFLSAPTCKSLPLSEWTTEQRSGARTMNLAPPTHSVLRSSVSIIMCGHSIACFGCPFMEAFWRNYVESLTIAVGFLLNLCRRFVENKGHPRAIDKDST